MPASNSDVKKSRERLGKMLANCRGKGMSQRSLAAAVGLPPSNMKYIEDGINAPTAEIYGRLIAHLNPEKELRKEMDKLYMQIRHTPPPDICDRVIKDENLMDAIRAMDDTPLTEIQSAKLIALFSEFRKENNKGDAYHG